MKIFSAIQPTGAIHIGNYAGAILNWVKMQDEAECSYCIADYHALTVLDDPKKLPKRVEEAAIDVLACGVDPEKANLFVQSHVPEHTELTWILSCCAPMGELNRMTQYKEKSERVESVNAGLFTYPILMAADILIYKADVVPVGEDQLQHLEVARVFARRFNAQYGKTFPEPQPRVSKAARVMSLNDPTKKMSKSLEGSAIMLSDPDDVIKRQIKRAVTDVGENPDEMSPGVKNLFTLLEAFAPAETYQHFLDDYAAGALRYKDLKESLTENMLNVLRPIRERRAELMANRGLVVDILHESAKKMRAVARETMREVREKSGLGALAKD